MISIVVQAQQQSVVPFVRRITKHLLLAIKVAVVMYHSISEVHLYTQHLLRLRASKSTFTL